MFITYINIFGNMYEIAYRHLLSIKIYEIKNKTKPCSVKYKLETFSHVETTAIEKS